MTKLNEQTDQFDKCGVYDGDGGVVPNKEADFSKENWGTALDFIEWFGVQKMPEFGIILIDASDAEEDTEDESMKCFDSATTI